MSSFKQADIDDIQLSYSVYHYHLIYIVTIKSGSHCEAYFINANTGSTEQAIKAPTERLKEEVDREIKSVGDPASPEMNDTSETSSAIQPFEYSAYVEPTETIEAETRPSPTQKPTEAESDEYSSVPITMKELSFVVQEVPESAEQADYETLFEGQCFNNRNGEKQNTGTVAFLTTYAALQKYLSDNAYPYLDKDGNSPLKGIDKSYFNNHSIIAVSGVFSDASYYACLTDIKTIDSGVYLEASLSYGESKSGEFYCRALTLYGVDKYLITPTDHIIVY